MFTFLKNEKVAFYRSDAEQAEWTQEELSLFCTFPYDPEKFIERGMTVLFQDPATEAWQAYEIRNCTLFPAEGYQQFTAEDLAVSELTDCHISVDIELTNITAKAALNTILSGTGWQVGTDSSSGKSSGDIGRGSVWQGVGAIRNNWNIHILPRVEIDSAGITGRYLDILSPEGTWRGLRISIDKNCSDPCVTYDDSDLYTALFGYGATYTKGEDPTEQQTVETDFGSVVWNKTEDHPAKPAGQKYLEWPERTALYGRNGKARFGYYQNSEIRDAATLLEKTWEALKICSEPKISITGTVIDFRRMGYHDEPVRLYDMAVVDVGEKTFYRPLIKLTVDLINPDKNRPTVGSYIPNIIYISRETFDYATDGGTGVSSGGGRGGSRSQKKQGEFETSLLQNERNIILEARQVDENRDTLRAAGIRIDPITGVVIYDEDVPNGIGSNFHVMSNQITMETTERVNQYNTLNAKISVESRKISLVVSEQSGSYRVNTASIVAGINADHGSYIKFQADTINLTGYVTASQLAATNATIDNLMSGNTTATKINCLNFRVGASTWTYGSSVVSKKSATISGTTIHYLAWTD